MADKNTNKTRSNPMPPSMGGDENTTHAGTNTDVAGAMPHGKGSDIAGSLDQKGADDVGGMGTGTARGSGTDIGGSTHSTTGGGGTGGLDSIDTSLSGGLTGDSGGQGAARRVATPPTAGGVAVDPGRGADLGGDIGMATDDFTPGMSSANAGGSRESDLGGGLSGGMESGMGKEVSGGMGSGEGGDTNADPRNEDTGRAMEGEEANNMNTSTDHGVRDIPNENAE